MFPPFRTRWWKVIWLFLVIIRIYKMRKVQSSLDEQELTSNLGLENARVWEIKVMRFFVLIRLGITSIGLSLYIYRPGKTYPFTSRITWGLFTKNPNSTRTVQTRPVDLSRCQIWLSTVFFRGQSKTTSFVLLDFDLSNLVPLFFHSQQVKCFCLEADTSGVVEMHYWRSATAVCKYYRLLKCTLLVQTFQAFV